MNPHEGAPVMHAGAKPEEAPAAVVLVHGRGAGADDMVGLSRALKRDDLAYFAPQAVGRTWYPLSFLAPIEQNEPFLSSALELLGQIVADVEGLGFAPEKIVLGGFSQGACLTSEFVARNPRRYGGLLVLSGGLIGPPGTLREYPRSLEGTPTFVGCSDVDPHIPLERVEETAEVLAGMGAAVEKRIYPGMPHTVNADEIGAVQEILGRVARVERGE